MLELVEKTRSSRQTFTMPQYIVDELESYVKLYGEKKSKVVAKAVEEFLKNRKRQDIVKRRLKAIEGLDGIAKDGTLENLDIKDIAIKKALKYAN